MADLNITNHGSIFLLHPLTEAGEEWISEHIPEDAQRHGNAVAVEHRFIEDIAYGDAEEISVTVEGDSRF